MEIDNLFSLHGKTAIVTGAGGGIGRGCALTLAAAGARVVVSDISRKAADAVAREIRDSGGEAEATVCDVLNPAHLEALVSLALSAYGSVNILVNNAGMGGGGRENIFSIGMDYVERIFRVNLFAPMRLIQLAAPHMRVSGYGSIVNISSMSSVNAEADMCVYASSKAALNHLAANLAHDLGPLGVRINNVAPGATRTDALASVLTPEMTERMLRTTPLHRLGEVADIARAVLFFASPASAWISGQTLMVNGGGTQTIG